MIIVVYIETVITSLAYTLRNSVGSCKTQKTSHADNDTNIHLTRFNLPKPHDQTNPIVEYWLSIAVFFLSTKLMKILKCSIYRITEQMNSKDYVATNLI